MKKQLLQFTLLVILVFILFISLLYLFFKNIEEQDIKEHFEQISSLSFPKEGKIIESDCVGGFGGGGYICNGKFTVSKKTYQSFKEAIAQGKTVTSYHKKAIEWQWGLVDDNKTIYFTYADY